MDKILAGCVAENTPVFFRRALNLVRSIRWFGGRFALADVAVCMIDGVRPEYRERLEEAGARVHVVPRWPENPMFNKVSILKVPGVEAYDCVGVLDCDLVVAQDPTPFLRPGVVQSKIADVDTVPYAAFAKMCERFSLPLPEATYLTTVDRRPILRYCNTGVLFGPPAVLLELLVPWTRYELLLSEDPSLLGPHHHHRQQAAFALAMIEHEVAFEEMTVALNFPLNQAHRPPTPEMAACDPVILHYHDAMDELGYLLPHGLPRAQERIRAFNARLAADGRRRAGPMLFAVGDDSATTLFRNLLDAHPQIAVVPEADLVPDVVRECRLAEDPAARFVEVVLAHEAWAQSGLDAARLRERVAEIAPFDVGEALRALYQLHAERAGKSRWADTTARNALFVEAIQDLLGEARFVHLLPAASAPAPSASALPSRVEAVRRRMHRLRHSLEIGHEELVDQPDTVRQRIDAFLDVAPAGPGREVRREARPAPPRPEDQREVAVCVAGMHRSGTSVAAGLLHACGVLLGDGASFLGPAEDNPLGYWEDQRFTALNEEILRVQGGGWDVPPVLSPGWEQGPALLPLRAEAAALLDARDPREAWWGFKDPRATLTFPFWRFLVPGLRLVVCLRNPLEVAASLTRRQRTSTAFGLQLWESYHRALCAATTADERLVTHHETMRRGPEAELERVLRWLGVSVSVELRDAACAQLVGRLRHHEASVEDLVSNGASDALVALYLDLCAEAAQAEAPRIAGHAVARVVDATTRAEYRAVLLEARTSRERAKQAEENDALRAGNDSLRTDNAALRTENAALRDQAEVLRAELLGAQQVAGSLAAALDEREREVAFHYAALAQHAERLSELADLRQRELMDVAAHARGLAAALERRSLRGLTTRLLGAGRKALHGRAGTKPQG